MVARIKLILSNDLRAEQLQREIHSLWQSNGLHRILLPEQNAGGILSVHSPPPAVVLEKTLDAVGAKVHAISIAKARKSMDEVKKTLQEDLASKAKACWTSVSEPGLSPWQVMELRHLSLLSSLLL